MAYSGEDLAICEVVRAAVLLLAPRYRTGEVRRDAAPTRTARISTGYTATYGNMTDSTHGWTLGGAGTSPGSYPQPQFSILQHLSLSEPVAGQFQFPVHLQCQRSQCQHQHLRVAADFPGSSQLFQGLQQRRKLRGSRACQLRDPRQQPELRRQLERKHSRQAHLSAGYQTGAAAIRSTERTTRGKTPFIPSICIRATGGQDSTWGLLHQGRRTLG